MAVSNCNLNSYNVLRNADTQNFLLNSKPNAIVHYFIYSLTDCLFITSTMEVKPEGSAPLILNPPLDTIVNQFSQPPILRNSFSIQSSTSFLVSQVAFSKKCTHQHSALTPRLYSLSARTAIAGSPYTSQF
jgi:hypothetical protein